MDSEYDKDLSFKQRIAKDLKTSGRPHLQQQPFKTGGESAFPQYRVVLCLGLLNTGLLITALVLGIYCAKAKDFQHISDSALTPLIIERDFLRNQSSKIKERLDIQVALENQRKANLQLQIQVKHQETVIDSLQSQIEILRTEKTLLESNKTALESSCARCPLGWILLRSSCYQYSLTLSNTKKNWPDSRADCIAQGGDLLVINNMEEQKVINKNNPKVPGVGSWWNFGFWMGLTDTATPGEWVWVNNVTENNAMYWRTDQPNRDSSLDGHCAAFAISRSLMYWKSWYNRNCENDQLHWVCEMQPR